MHAGMKYYIPGTGGTGGGGIPPPTSNCSPDSVYFVNEIMPIISSNCTMSGCHDNITHAEGVNLTTYTNIMRYVRAVMQQTVNFIK